VRIPLDYYRILGLPIQATSDQLRQAHRDRTLQLPRREYSDAAIAIRKQLIDQAYAVLSDPAARRRYDARFLARTYEMSPDLGGDDSTETFTHANDLDLHDNHTPSVEIEENQFIGALLILQELGEYELVLKLGRPFLTGGSASLSQPYSDPIIFSDIVLTVALACLELGREQWQQGQYENAAEALETGQQLLLREGLFVNVRGEIQSDLYRLRPYRVLELLAAPPEGLEGRQTGLELLQDMLRDRGGIDGTADDHSGLNIDDFLKFIQQLRSYLTAEEQQTLFCREASRPSAVATYLAVYALMARGFAERYPELVHQAGQFLAPLTNRQDVFLERAICSLLLGQTDEASRSLELSQEHDSIEFIRQHSYDSPDLLPGLCLYAEQWFHDEVFPHFRDLAECRLSLKEYFADPHVQTYLEALPEEVAAPEPAYTPALAPALRSPVATPAPILETTPAPEPLEPVAARTAYTATEPLSDREALIAAARARIASRSATATLDTEERFTGGVSTAERDPQPDSEPEAIRDTPPPPPPTRNRAPQNGTGRDGKRPRRSDRPTPNRSFPKVLMPLALLFCVVLFGGLGAWLFRTWQTSLKPNAQASDRPFVQLDQPLVSLPDDTPIPTKVEVLDATTAQQLIEQWLSTKAKAMGATYEATDLEKILTGAKLAEWQAAATEAKRDGTYRDYKHEVKVETVELLANGQIIPATSEAPPPTSSPSPTAEAATASPAPAASTPASPTAPPAATNPDQATIVAQVKETVELYRNGKVDGAAQTDDLKVQYNLVRQDGEWRIQGWQIL